MGTAARGRAPPAPRYLLDRLRLEDLRIELLRADVFRVALRALVFRADVRAPDFDADLRDAVLRADDLRDDALREDFRAGGTFAPFSRASDSPIAIACWRLVTLPPRPPRPLFSVPFLRRRIALSTDLLALRPYLRVPDLRAPDLPPDFLAVAMKASPVRVSVDAARAVTVQGGCRGRRPAPDVRAAVRR